MNQMVKAAVIGMPAAAGIRRTASPVPRRKGIFSRKSKKEAR